MSFVEINEDQPNGKRKGYFFRACYRARESATIALSWQRFKDRQRTGKLYSEKWKESSSVHWLRLLVVSSFQIVVLELKNWCFQTAVLWKTLESPLDCKETKLLNSQRNQPWIFIGRTDADASPVLWPPDVKSQLTGKDPDAGKDWRQKEKRATENEMVGGHHQLNEYEFEQTPGDRKGQGILACCSPWGGKRVGHNWMTKQQRYDKIKM